MFKRKRLRKGQTKIVKGKTYKLGKTSRWERFKQSGKAGALIGGGIAASLFAFPMTIETQANIGVLKGIKKYGLKKGAARITAATSTASYLGAGLLAVGAGMKIGAFISAKQRQRRGQDTEGIKKISRIATKIMLGGGALTLAGTAGLVSMSARRGFGRREMTAKGWKIFKRGTKKLGVSYRRANLDTLIKLRYGKNIKSPIRVKRELHALSFYAPNIKLLMAPKRSAVAVHELTHAKQWAGKSKTYTKIRGVAYTAGTKLSSLVIIPGAIMGSKRVLGDKTKKQMLRDKRLKKQYAKRYAY